MPVTSSNLPKAGGPRKRFDSVLLRMGFTYALPVTREAVVSYTALPPLPKNPQADSLKLLRNFPLMKERGGIFLLHYPWSRLHRTLSGILPCEARTFLTPKTLRHIENISVHRRNRAAIICSTYSRINNIHEIHVSDKYFLYPIILMRAASANLIYTWKQEPPMNSRIMEFWLIPSLGIGRK